MLQQALDLRVLPACCLTQLVVLLPSTSSPRAKWSAPALHFLSKGLCLSFELFGKSPRQSRTMRMCFTNTPPRQMLALGTSRRTTWIFGKEEPTSVLESTPYSRSLYCVGFQPGNPKDSLCWNRQDNTLRDFTSKAGNRRASINKWGRRESAR